MTDENTTKDDAAVTEAAEETKVEEIKTEEAPKSEEKAKKLAASGKFKELIETIEKLSVLELSELVKELEERFGVSAVAPVMMAGGAVSAPAEAEEEKDSFTVVLAEAGAQKIAVIKAVRELRQDLGLVEAKTLVEKGGAEVLKDVKKEEAQEAKTKLEAAGAKVELK